VREALREMDQRQGVAQLHSPSKTCASVTVYRNTLS
jgi:hypothetical protein